MVEAAAAQPILLAIGGGAIHAGTYGTKAYIDGETLELGKMALTVVLGAVIGLLFAIAGYTPTAAEWPILLAAYTGFIAELEAGLKLLVRGYVYESEERFRRAADEATGATADLATENRGRLIGGFLARAPSPTPRADEDDGEDVEDLSDHDDSHLRLGMDESVPDPYPEVDEEPVEDTASHAGFAPRGDHDGENGDRLYQFFEWFNGNPDWETSKRPAEASDEDAEPEDSDEHEEIITHGP